MQQVNLGLWYICSPKIGYPTHVPFKRIIDVLGQLTQSPHGYLTILEPFVPWSVMMNSHYAVNTHLYRTALYFNRRIMFCPYKMKYTANFFMPVSNAIAIPHGLIP
jgi:hypothetical protein